MAILLWTLEHLSESDAFATVFAFSTVPFKLALLVAPLFFIPPLSRFLCGRFHLASILASALIVTTWLAILAYLPFRQSFVESFDADTYHWYHDGMIIQHADLAQWKADWNRRRPHITEATIVAAFYGALIMVCSFRRWRLFGGSIVIAVGAYLFLELIPLYFGLLEWDYDVFLKGIVFNSISLDLSPPAFWYPSDFSIFLYSFSFIFFAVTSGFIAAYAHDAKCDRLGVRE